jgi:hypothetical protein
VRWSGCSAKFLQKCTAVVNVHSPIDTNACPCLRCLLGLRVGDLPVNLGGTVYVDSNSSAAHGCIDTARMANEYARGHALDAQVLIYTQYYNYTYI